MKLDKSELKLYAVTDRAWLNERPIEDDIEKAIIGGATIIQLREKNLSIDEFIEEAIRVKALCKKYNVKLIINDNLDVMKAIDADGIHIGQNDLDAKYVRSQIKDKILGVSCQTVEEALKALNDGADYLGVGAVFSTSTKLDAIDVDKETLFDICNSVNIPVVAIGGINLDNIKDLKNTMIDGVALVSAIFAKEDIINETRKLKLEIDKIIFNKNNYDLFIVDYDGTILDSMNMWKDICSRFVKSYGKTPHSNLDYETTKMTVIEVAEYLRNKFFMELSIDEVEKNMENFILNEYKKAKIKDGAINFLDEIKEAGDVVLFSATSQNLLEQSIKTQGLEGYFKHIYSASDLNTTKSDGSGYMKVLSINDKYKNPLVIEDAIHAIKGAKFKGLTVLAVYDKAKIKKEIMENADFYLNLRKGL